VCDFFRKTLIDICIIFVVYLPVRSNNTLLTRRTYCKMEIFITFTYRDASTEIVFGPKLYKQFIATRTINTILLLLVYKNNFEYLRFYFVQFIYYIQIIICVMQEDELYSKTIYRRYFTANGCIKINKNYLQLKNNLFLIKIYNYFFLLSFSLKTVCSFFATVIIVAVKIYDE